MRITATEARAMFAQQATGKAGAKPAENARVKGATSIVVDGIRFQSRREARAWADLCRQQRLGLIYELRRQVKIGLRGRDGPILTPKGRPMNYVADFTFREYPSGAEVVADAKGHPTEVYLIKRAILAAQGVTVREL